MTQPTETSSQSDVADEIVRVVEATAVGQSPDRSTLLRATREARTAWPGSADSRWWKWTAEALGSIDMRGKVFEGSVKQVAALTRRGARLLTRGQDGHWVLAEGAGWRGVRFREPLTGRSGRTSHRRLAERLGYTSPDDAMHWIVVESPVIDRPAPEALTPLKRVLSLLYAERGDVWVVLVFALVAGVLSLATPIAVEALVNTVAFGRFLQPVVVLALMLFTFLAFGAAMRALQTFVVEIVQRRLFARTVDDLAYRLPRSSREEFDDKYGPELANRFLDVVTVQKVVAQLLLDGVALTMATMVGMAVLAFYHPFLLGFDVVLLALIAFTIFVLGRGAVASSLKESKNKYRMTSWLQDVVRCRTAFGLGGANEFAANRADLLTTEYLVARKKHFRILMRQILFALGMQAVAGTVLLGLGGWLVISGELTLGQLVAAELIVAIIVGSFAKLGKHMESYYDLLASTDKLGALFDVGVEDQIGVFSIPANGPAALRCSHVSYNYSSGPGLSDFDLEVDPGDCVAVLGPAGSGKSTLAEILYGLRAPKKGYVELDQVDPRDVRPEVFRSHVALAGDVEIFHGTIEENVQLERASVGAAELRGALRQVGLLEELLALPEGLKTQLLPSGHPLSEGQLRRLVIARALAGDPRLLVVDGLLDGLGDDEFEVVAHGLLQDRTRTTVVLTGRRAVAERCERVVELRSKSPAANRLTEIPQH